MAKKYRVKILSQSPIPLVGGSGPILNPIWIEEKTYNILKTLGYDVRIVETRDLPTHLPSVSAPEAKPEKPVVEVTEEVAEEVSEEEEEVEETYEEEVEETYEEEVEEEEVEEVLVNDENLSGEAYYTEEFLTKKKAMTILDNRGVEYDASSNAKTLKALVLETNPVVEE